MDRILGPANAMTTKVRRVQNRQLEHLRGFRIGIEYLIVLISSKDAVKEHFS